jgi:hypothetical protein
MKKPSIILTLLCLHIFLTAAVSQTAKFDIVTYSAPAGWTVDKDADSIRFSKESGGNYCVISLTRSVDSLGDAAADFELLWKTMAVEGLNAPATPNRGKAGEKNGWQAEVGVGPFDRDPIKGAALLTTFTGNGKLIAILAITNSDAYQPDIENFINGVTLPTIAAQKAPAAGPAAALTGDAAKLVGRWQRSGSSSPSYADPASWGTSGYTKSRYEFHADGTYTYTERSFRYSYQNIIIVRENGRFAVAGDTLTITPAKSTITAYKKAGGVDALGAVASTQSRKLETASYKFTFHYFSGIQEWNLVLQADAPTERDGKFSTLKVFENAWYFDQKYVNNDLTAVRID